MLINLHDLFPDPEALLALDREAVGRLILKTGWRFFDREAFVGNCSSGYPRDYSAKIEAAVSKSWTWLKNHEYLDQDPTQREGILMVTDEGKNFMVSAPLSVDARGRQRIQKGFLHPVIEETSYAAYQSGRYSDAIGSAYKEIEIRVRNLSQAPSSAIGVSLMNRAFASPAGPLTDQALVPGEQIGLANLFAGAFGWIRNPTAHRDVAFDSVATAELLFFASYMMRRLDEAEHRLNGATSPPV
jgi:uncharacterized protein (TIGR02391 family)